MTDAEGVSSQSDERLRLEIEELRASRERIVLAADGELRRIERELHAGVLQHLVALSVNLQRGVSFVGSDPEAAKALLEEMGRDVQHALDETARLEERIYAPLLEAGALAAALRSAAVAAGVPASVDVAIGSSYPPELVRTIHLCWLEVLEHEGGELRATISVREEDGALTFEIARETVGTDAELERLCDRVEALGGRLTIASEAGRGTCVSGRFPFSR